MSNKINPGQQDAIDTTEGPVIVLAGPGSGKTFVIVHRLLNMINNCQICPETIMVITFTKASASEMQKRFEDLCCPKYYPVTFGTFHAIFFKILKENLGYTSSNIVSEKEKRIMLKSILAVIESEKAHDCVADETTLDNILSQISCIKNNNLLSESIPESFSNVENFEIIYEKYNELLKLENKIDFDDMQLDCLYLLKSNPELLRKYQKQYKYFLIDEFQDINPVQYEIIKMLSKPEDNLFIVGDDDQSIYGFRGSKPEIMLNFPKEYKNAKMIILGTNYRSNNDIVNKACSFIKNNHNRYPKKLIANTKSNKEILLITSENHDNENQKILNTIRTVNRLDRQKTIAVIYRTNKAARPLSSLLAKENIPYIFTEKITSFFNHSISKDILAILAFSYGENTRENFLRFMNKPVRYIPRSLITDTKVDLKYFLKNKYIKPYLSDNIKTLIRHLDLLKELDIYSAVNYIYQGMGYKKYILHEYKEKYNNYDEALDILNLFHSSTKKIQTFHELKEYIEAYNDSLDTDNKHSSVNPDYDNPVTLITMHSSKGLEYHTVIIPGLNENYMPQSKANTPESIEEERRVFYVAMTRAKENLYLSYVKNNNDRKMLPSRFLREIEGLKEKHMDEI